MVPKSSALVVKLAVDAGTSISIENWRNAWVVVTGAFNATFDIQGSIDDTNWVTLWTVTAAGVYELATTLIYLRTNTTAYVAGTPTATATGIVDY